MFQVPGLIIMPILFAMVPTGALLGLLVLPLCVPVLVFGAGAVGAQLIGINPAAHLSLLGAFLAVSSLVGLWAACAALRVALD